MDSFTLRKIEFDAVRHILAEHCACSLGKALAVQISPSRNPQTIRRWLQQVSEMVEAIRDVALPPLGGATDVSAELERIVPAGGAGGEDFAKLAGVLDAVGNVRTYLYALPEKLSLLREMADALTDFAADVEAIRAVIDSDGTVRDSASEKLAKIRRQMRETALKIHDVIHGYLRQPDVAKLLQNATVMMEGDRYVLPVKVENRGRLPGVVHRASKSGATVFVEPNASVELNNHLADLYNEERLEIRRLLNALTLRIHPRHEAIQSSVRTLAQVDLLAGKAQYAYQCEMVCPEIVERGALELPAARHPLLVDQQRKAERADGEAKAHDVVPVDIRLGSDFDLLVITGSNTGGKTVTLKTLALLVVMAQSGMHVPAGRGAALPVFHDVYIDVGDEQSLEQSLSTFGAHVKRMKYILRKAGRNTLVLLDELGSGTDPEEGGAIGQAVLDELRRIGCLGMVTTHLGVLKAYAYNHDRVDNASVEFDTATLSPTYHLRIGSPGESHAITVARRLGLPKRVTGGAKRHLSGQGKQFRRAIQATSVARQSAEAARVEARQAQLAAETEQESYQAKLADLHRLQEEFETWLATLAEWQPGREVRVPALGTTGRLVRMELHRQRAIVDTGSVQAEVPLRDLMPDLGQNEVRREIAQVRQEILDRARGAEEIRAEAQHLQKEYQRSLHQQRQRARQFDLWLQAIGRLKVGQDVPVARRPGHGKLVSVDLPGLRATVQIGEKQVVLSLQDLFPQTGPFARGEGGADRSGGPSGRRGKQRGGKRSRDERHTGGDKAPRGKRPMARRDPDSKAARKNAKALKELRAGDAVYVVPFHKRATLIRLKSGDVAVVQSGIFEMEVPLADLEPVRTE